MYGCGVTIQSISFSEQNVMLSIPNVCSNKIGKSSYRYFLLATPSFRNRYISPSLGTIEYQLSLYSIFIATKGLCQVESTNISSYLSLVLCTHITNKRLIPNIRIILFQQFLGYFPSTIFRSFCISCSFSNFILSINSTNFSHGYSISYIFIRHNTFIYIRRML